MNEHSVISAGGSDRQDWCRYTVTMPVSVNGYVMWFTKINPLPMDDAGFVTFACKRYL